MILQRIKSAGSAHNSYFIGSGTHAAVIDPRRDCQVYLELAVENGMKIDYIFETHRNEDYAIGSLELAAACGASIHHGAGLEWGYGNTLEDNQEFGLGKLKITAISTPGHTDESLSYTVIDLDSGDKVVLVFTGDALFVNDVGRTDLYGPEEAERLAAGLYESLHQRLLPLGDGVIICPGHGAGSVCGSNIADRDDSTIGTERLMNPMLQLGREEFIRRKLAERLERPHYFSMMERYNLEGPPLLNRLPLPAPLSPKNFKREMDKGAVVVDVSEPAAFGAAHIAGSYSIWLDGLPVFGGWVLPYDRPLLLVLGDDVRLDTAVRYLVRSGYDRVTGYLKGGVEAWYNAGFPIENLPLISVNQLRQKIDNREDIRVLDVRDDVEWDDGHIDGAQHIYVGHIEERLSEIPDDRPTAVVCAVGHRAGVSAAILQRAGRKNLYNVLGGMTAWKASEYPMVKV